MLTTYVRLQEILMQLDKQDRQQKLEETFQGVKNPKAEVERGFRFWDVVSAVSALSLLFLRWN